MRLRLLPTLALLVLVCATVSPHAQQLRKIGEMELALVGLSATVDGARPAIPKNVASGVKILIAGGGATLTPGAAARLIGAFDVEAEISGPSFGETVTVRQSITPASTTTDLILPLPVMAVSGEHTLSNLRIVSGGRPVIDLQPHTVPVDVVEQVLITSVRTRPLTLQEIKDKGIVLDSDDYLGFEFTLGVLLESKPVNIAFPVVFDRQGIAVPLPQSVPGLNVRDFDEPVFVPKMIPMMMKIPKLGPGNTLGLNFDEDQIRIPSLLVIPGEVGYLKQFFSAQLFVGNGTPATANLIVRDLKGTLELPKGLDATANTPDDPLSLAETVNGVQPLTMTIAGVGPDAKAGTDDDITNLRAGEQGQAEFLVRGDLEGFHNIAFDIEGVLDGLPTGPITVTGRATGGVLVRNPFFDVSFTLPTVVRANEPFKLYATVTNKGEGIANDVSMTLDSASLSGLSVIGDASKSIDTLMAGEAETLVFDFMPTRTGQAVATYLRFEGPGATGSLKFKVGVGERNVPLSPDTLVLPAPVDELPDTVIATAMRVLGQAWSIANTPSNAMPPGVTRISKQVVTTKALSLAEAGLRIRLGQAEADAIRDLLADFYGPAPIDRGFDQLLRMTDAGRNFTRAVGAALAPTAAANASAFEAAYAAVAASGSDFVSFSIANGAGNADVDVKLLDAGNRQLIYTGGNSDPRPTLTSAAIAPLGLPATSPLFGLIAAPSALPYTIELTGRGGTAVDLSVTYPRGDGRFTRAYVTGVTIAIGAKARVVIDPLRASPAIEIDADANGTIDTTAPLQTDVIAAAGPHLISASVVGPETLDSAGPFGFNVALLFDRLVDETAAANLSHYSIPDNRFVSTRRQLSGRLVFGALAMPEGPYVPSSVTVSGMTDPRGIGVGSESATLRSLLEDAGAVLSGRVINGDGQLAAGLRVIYFGTNSWKDCQTAELMPLAETRTDASGRYQFHYIYADRCIGWRMQAVDEINHSDRTVGGKVLSPGQRITADIALLGRGGVTGIVRDLNGTPVPDAQVIAISTLEPTVGGATKTDGDGRYLINGITVGPISVKSAKGFSVGTSAGVIARAGTIATADVTLNAGSVTVSGVVKAVENLVATPVAGAIVVFEGPDPLGTGLTTAGAVTSGVDGKYTLTDMPAGPYVIRATLSNGDRATLTGASTAGDVITGRDILIQIQRNARVSGVVRYPDGSAVATPIVTLSGLGTVGEADGTFVIENALVSANPQPIVAYSPDGLREGHSQVLLNQSGQQLSNVIVTMNGIGTLDLVVLDSLGQPVRNQIVQIARTGHNISPTDCTAFYLAPTDEQGRVQFAGLEVGAVRVVSIRATANGIDIAKLDTTIPYEGATVNGVLRFGGGGVVRGTVLDDQNNAVFGANIEITSRIYNAGFCAMVPGVSHRLRTSLNGEYRVTGVPVGPVGVSASQEFFPTPVGGNGVLARDGDELVIDLKLIHTTAGKMTGRVFMPDGVTLVGAGVSVSAIGALPEVLVYTNAEGKFAFPKIFPAGTYTITVRDAITGYVAQERVALTAGTDLEHDFRLKGRGTVRVKVVDGGGVAVSNALVTLKESDYPKETFEGVVEPSNEGVVTFINVHEGDFSVSASDANARGGRISAELPSNGATVEVTVRLTVTGTVTGRFMLPDQTLVPFGVVKLISNGREIGQSTTESGEDTGHYQFSYVPAGTVRISAFDPATGRSGVAIGQLTTEGQLVTLDVQAQGLGIVTGVITSNGVPQDGANVSVSSGSFRASANADGDGVYYVPGVPEGTITVRADIEGALSSTATGTLLGDGTTLTLDVPLQESGTVVGVVTAADGVTPAPPSIVTMPIGAGRFTTTTNDLGEYRFDLVPAGTRSVSVDVIGSIDTAIGSTSVSGGQTATLPLQLIGVGTIAGTAQTASGLPIGGTVTLTGSGVVPWSMTLTVNPDGTFIAAQVLAGPFTAQVRHTTGSITLYGTATGVVAPGATTNILVTLQSTGDVRGTVVRADGTTPATGAIVTLLLGSATKGTAQVFSTGEFSFTGLPLGVYSVTVYDTVTNGYARALNLNLAANGDIGDAGVLTLDTTAPAVVSIDPADGAIGVSRTKPIVITFTDPIGSTSGVSLKKDGTAQSASKSLSADGRVLTMTGTWLDGVELTVEVATSVTDVFGRHPAAPFTSHFITVDTTAPKVDLVSPVDDAIQVSNTTAIVATFSEPIVNAAVDGLIVVTRDGVPVTGTTVQGPANVLTFTPAPALVDNAIYLVTIDGAVDASGNEQGNAKTTNFATTDTVPPVLTINSPLANVWLSDNTPAVSVSRSDATSGIETTSGAISIDGTPVTTSRSSTAMSHSVSSPLADGTHLVEANSADQAGNVGTAAPVSIKIDATPPSVAAITQIGDGTTIVGTTTITATASDVTSGIERIEIYRDGVNVADLSGGPTTFTGTWNASTTAEGQYALTARAFDNAGNAGAFSDPIAIVVDNDPLTLTITAPVANLRTRKPFTASATTNEPVHHVDFTLGGVTLTDSEGISPHSQVLSVATLPEDDATITVTAYGLLGEVVTATRVIVVDRSSPVARWPFEEGTGTTTADASGFGHTATLINGAAWSTQGQFGKAISFDGVDDGVTAADHEDFDAIDAVSMSAWVRPTASGTVQTLIEKSGATPAYSLGIGPDGRAEAVVYPNGSAVVAQTVNPLTLQEWSHLAATYDGSALKLFVNGALIATTGASGPLPVTDGAIWLGRSETGNFFNGRLDEVRVYDRALLTSEVSALASTAAKSLLAGGSRATFVAQPGGTAWAMGQHNNGSLGIGTGSAVVPTPMAVISDLANIAADNTHGLALTRAGVLYAWGNTAIGDGFSSARSSPVPISLSGVVQVAAGTQHSGAVLANGDAYTWGTNTSNQLCDGTATASLVPKLVMTGVRAIAMSQTTTLFLKNDGTVWGCGTSSSGQLGNGSTSPNTIATPVQMIGITNAVAIALGDAHSIVLLADGTLRGVGLGNRTGDGTGSTRTTSVAVVGLSSVVQIAANGGFTLARKADGTVWAWGSNSSSELGDGTTTTRPTPQQVGTLADVADIGAGNDQSIAVTASGVVYTWGTNGFSELGDGTTRTRRTPIAISAANYVWKVATPEMNDSSGTYNQNRNVPITVATAGATIHYTRNGAAPTQSDPTVASGGTVLIDQSQTLSVRAFKNPMPPSNVDQLIFEMQVGQPTVSPIPGTYTSARTVTITTITPNAALYYTLDGSEPTEASTPYTGSFVVAHTTTVKAKGFKSGWTPSLTRTNLYTMNFGTLSAPTFSPASGTYVGSVSVSLFSSQPGATIRYTTNGSSVNTNSPIYTGPFPLTTTTTVRAKAYHPDYVESSQSQTAYTLQAAPPQFSVPPGEYPAGTTVTITGDPATTIRYTIDGDDPTTSDPIVASGATIVLGNFTLKAKATLTNALDSTITASTYTVSGAIAPVSVVAGQNHAFALTPDGRLFGWGYNFRGQMGDGSTASPRPVPQLLNDLAGVVGVAGGMNHSLARTADGRLWAFGYNLTGQLGDGTTTQRNRPVPVSTWTNVAAMAAGLDHSVAMLANGDVYTWGSNGSGQLGDGTTTQSLLPKLVMTGVMAIGAGHNHTLFVKLDGTVWGVGWNANGQLGDGTTINKLTPVQMNGISNAIAVNAGQAFSTILLADGTVRAVGNNGNGQLGDGTNLQRLTPVTVAGLSNVVAIDSGTIHSVALKSDGTVWSWGTNSQGVMGNLAATSPQYTPIQAAGLPPVAAVASGDLFSVAVTAGGVVYAWGYNGNSELGDGTTRSRSLATPTSEANYNWKTATPTFSLNANTFSAPFNVTLSSVTAGATIYYTRNGAEPTEADSSVASGGTVLIDSSQTLTAKAFKAGMPASNADATAYVLQVTQPSITPASATYSSPQTVTITTSTPLATIYYTLDNSEPTEASTLYSGPFPLATTTTIKAKGFKNGWAASQTRIGTITFNYGILAMPVPSPAPGTYVGSVEVSLSSSQPGAKIHYTTNGSVSGTGTPQYTAPFTLTTTSTVRAKAVHPDYTTSPELNVVYTIQATAPTISLASGTYAPGTTATITGDPTTTIRITTDGTDPTTSHPSVPSGTTMLVGNFTLKARAFKTSNTNSAVASATYSLTGVIGPGTIAGSGQHVAIATPYGRVLTWGLNSFGQLGDGTFNIRYVPTVVQELTGVTGVSTGANFTLSLTLDGRVYAWGENGNGQLGDSTTSHRSRPVQSGTLTNIVAIDAGGYHSLALSADGQVFAWGYNGLGQLGDGTTTQWTVPKLVSGLPEIAAISAGLYHSVAVARDGRVFAWGGNSAGELGDGTTAFKKVPTEIGLTNVASINAGEFRTTAILRDGRRYAWGSGSQGALGIGGTFNTNTPFEATGQKYSSVTFGDTAAIGVRTDGTTAAWGDNPYGQVGIGVMGSFYLMPQTIPGLSSVSTHYTGIAAGAVTEQGAVWTWGQNGFGQIGDGTNQGNHPSPQLSFTIAEPWAAAAPVFNATSNGDGTFTLAITSSLAGATIRYTIDGSDPTGGSQEVPANGLLINQSQTVRARVFAPGRAPSAITATAYVITP